MSGIARTSLIVAIGLLLGRISGLFRELLLASTFGVSDQADIAILILTIPDLLANILVGGALSVALIPEFKGLGQPRASHLFVQASLAVGIGFAAFAALASVFAQDLVFVFAPGLNESSLYQAASLVSITLWLIPLTALAGISLAYLHAHKRFGVASLGTLIYNLTVIAGLALIASHQGGLGLLCAFAVLGGMLRWGAQFLAMPRPLPVAGALKQPLLDRALVRRFMQAAAASGLLLVLPVAARALASFNGEGAIASFNYAIKLTEFALGVSITVLSVAIFPHLVESFVGNDDSRFKELLRNGLWWVMVLSLVTTVPLLWFSRDFVEMAYGWGKMTPQALDDINALMVIGLLSLPFQGLSSMLAAISNARRDALGPLIASLLALVVFLPLGYALHKVIGLPGIMVALVMSYVLAVCVQLILLSRQHQLRVIGPLFSIESRRAFVIAVLACSIIGVMAMGRIESTFAGILLAGLAAVVALLACMATHPRYRLLMLAWLKQRASQ